MKKRTLLFLLVVAPGLVSAAPPAGGVWAQRAQFQVAGLQPPVVVRSAAPKLGRCTVGAPDLRNYLFSNCSLLNAECGLAPVVEGKSLQLAGRPVIQIGDSKKQVLAVLGTPNFRSDEHASVFEVFAVHSWVYDRRPYQLELRFSGDKLENLEFGNHWQPSDALVGKGSAELAVDGVRLGMRAVALAKLGKAQSKFQGPWVQAYGKGETLVGFDPPEAGSAVTVLGGSLSRGKIVLARRGDSLPKLLGAIKCKAAGSGPLRHFLLDQKIHLRVRVDAKDRIEEFELGVN